MCLTTNTDAHRAEFWFPSVCAALSPQAGRGKPHCALRCRFHVEGRDQANAGQLHAAAGAALPLLLSLWRRVSICSAIRESSALVRPNSWVASMGEMTVSGATSGWR